jgi:hypothetical protein
MDGHWCLRKKALKDAGGKASFEDTFAVTLDSVGWKKDVIGFCTNGVMPLMFQDKMRRVFASSGGRGTRSSVGGVCRGTVTALEPVLRRFAGGGLMLMVA